MKKVNETEFASFMNLACPKYLSSFQYNEEGKKGNLYVLSNKTETEYKVIGKSVINKKEFDDNEENEYYLKMDTIEELEQFRNEYRGK